MTEKILCTISGGRTSGFMAVFLKERYPNKNILFCFANTGKENEETLIFFVQSWHCPLMSLIVLIASNLFFVLKTSLYSSLPSFTCTLQ